MSQTLSANDIIYDWNASNSDRTFPDRYVLNDETLRDGLQSASSSDPSLSDKQKLLHLMDQLGIGAVNIGLPGAGAHVVESVTALAREIQNSKLKIRPNCAARTLVTDIEPIANISQKVGLPIEVMAFIGSSPIRIFAEDWDDEFLLKTVRIAISFSVKQGLETCLVTEDTVRARPELLLKLYRVALDEGATRICLCDTVGHATPEGVRALLSFAKEKIIQEGGYKNIQMDWHGHNDRGLALINAMEALHSGADRVHATALGMGERCGNTPMDQLIANLYLLGAYKDAPTRMVEYCELASKACGQPIPANYPVIGRDAFRTGTGVHASAIVKAREKGDVWLADRVYSGVPAAPFGRTQSIEIGPLSGASNVIHWLTQQGISPEPELVERVLKKAKSSKQILSDEEVCRVIKGT